ncbi:flagellar export chaperone FliS [Gaopeijia maritima]|uniref:Flagellar export chaperone FliS n=1 Tax=Gaopeijia maritima TaxID=3119007 RepID=A0ABU9EGB9_9BACT
MRGAALYQNSRVVGARRENLVVLLYERLLADLRGAVVAIEEGNIEIKAQRLDHALDILFELLGTLDHDSGGEIAGRLSSLYSFFIAEINVVSRTLETPRLERIITMIDGLYGSWREVTAGAAGGGAAPGDPVGAGR